MANEEHLEILKQGVEVWNQWREENSNIRPDLSYADLTWLDLDGVDLHAASLYKALFHETVLSRANLQRADLRYTDLCQADLRQANLSHANLGQANLRGKDFSEVTVCKANFSGANLGGANMQRKDLGEATLSGANLRRADLSGTDLREADLREADFIETNLYQANLFRAAVFGARFNRADLRGADFREADLRRADLSEADLYNTEFGGADVGWATFGNVDLSVAKELGTVIHRGPSTIGIDTIYSSKGEIPEAFLRGAGVPDSLIEFARSLVVSEQAIDFYSCFISYSSRDQAFAERLHADLQDKGVRCWFAPEDMKIGDRIRSTLDQSIRVHDKLLLILSKHSVESDWVEQEVETALARERKEKRTVLFPIRLDDTVMEIDEGWPALIRNTRHIGDFRNWKDHDAYQQGLGRLLRDLKAEDNKGES